ncbi:MAG: hypothetical protein IJD58_12010 [Lachnospiraceae bacterium]|nr:hypothetical protein [Lachnospiraceae bacterium]
MKGCANYVHLDSEWKENDKCKQVEIFQISLKDNLTDIKTFCKEIDSNQNGQRVAFDISFNNKNHKIYFTEDRYGDPVYMEWHLDNTLLFQNGKIDGNEFKYFSDSNYTNEAINEKIYEELNVLYLEWQKAIAPKEGAFLLNQEPNDSKTLEITAPRNTTITGTVTEQGQTIHTETL